jgi:hypothetical protein
MEAHDRIIRVITELKFDRRIIGPLNWRLDIVQEPGQQLKIFRDPLFKIVIFQYQNSVYFFV